MWKYTVRKYTKPKTDIHRVVMRMRQRKRRLRKDVIPLK